MVHFAVSHRHAYTITLHIGEIRMHRGNLPNWMGNQRVNQVQLPSLVTQQNSNSICHLQGDLDSDGVVTVDNCRQHSDCIVDLSCVPTTLTVQSHCVVTVRSK